MKLLISAYFHQWKNLSSIQTNIIIYNIFKHTRVGVQAKNACMFTSKGEGSNYSECIGNLYNVIFKKAKQNSKNK